MRDTVTHENERIDMGRINVAICLLVGCLVVQPVWSQRATSQGLVSEQELITLSKDMPFDQALRVIQTFANRVVVDPEHRTTPIGVDIDRESWRQALDQIAQSNGLQVAAHENYLQLLPVQQGEGGPAPEVSIDSREVNISAVFFQADQSVLREFGIDWSTLSGGKVDVNAAYQGGGASRQFSVGVGANINRSLSVDLLIQTFESENTGEVIARPQIKVRSGKTGFIQVGSDFSVTTADFAGNAITQFYNTGTILRVEPVILSEDEVDFVDLQVEAERSSLIDPVRNVISKTVARTFTLLRDGEQTAIAGLYGHETTATRSGVPIFKDLPPWFLGLRYLFGFDSQLVSKTELIVLLKVEIVPSVRQRAERELEEVEPESEFQGYEDYQRLRQQGNQRVF